jgi:hypothetical protein
MTISNRMTLISSVQTFGYLLIANVLQNSVVNFSCEQVCYRKVPGLLYL